MAPACLWVQDGVMHNNQVLTCPRTSNVRSQFKTAANRFVCFVATAIDFV